MSRPRRAGARAAGAERVLSRVAVLALVAGALGNGCDRGADGAANRFLNRYYVTADLEQALTFATGRAAEKIRAEIEETREARALGGVSSGDRKINYETTGSDTLSPTEVRIRYRLLVVSGGSEYPKDVVLDLVRQEGSWLVSDFETSEPPSAPPSAPLSAAPATGS